MARMSGNVKRYSRDFGDSLQLTYCNLYSGATCHITPQGFDYIPGSLEYTEITLKLRMDILSQRSKKYRFK